MSAPKFTPGPWVVEYHCATADIVSANGAPLVFISAVGNRTEEEDTANARLIAASPDMCAVLERLESAIGITDLEDCVALARAALAKARGEA